MTEKVLLKDVALNPGRIARIGREVQAVCPGFDAAAFARDVLAQLSTLELKARITHTARMLDARLPVTGAQAVDVLLRSLPATPQDAGTDSDFGLYLYAPHSEYVARFARTRQDLPCSLEALRRLTAYFSAEDAARYFLNDFPDETLAALASWTDDPDHRVRRLASEATRSRLPWSSRITLPIDAGLPILERLRTDTSRFVTRSVANHLSDIAMERPELVLQTLGRWKEAGGSCDLDFIAREALRGQLRAGDPAAYDFLGYPSNTPVTVSAIRLERTEMCDGETLGFALDLVAVARADLRVDYVITAPGQRGTREKVYRLTTTAAVAGQTLHLAKQHVLRSTANSALRPGQYTLTIQVNGRRFEAAPFHVVEN